MRLPTYWLRHTVPWWLGGYRGIGHKLAMQRVDHRLWEESQYYGGYRKAAADKRERKDERDNPR